MSIAESMERKNANRIIWNPNKLQHMKLGNPLAAEDWMTINSQANTSVALTYSCLTV
jgi:hypothetical protein